MTLRISLAALLAASAFPVLAHHGVAGVGAAALEGPGAPIEAAGTANLPAGKTLLVLKVDDARFKRYDWAAPNAKYSRFTMLGLGYGVTPWLSLYAFVPHNAKVEENGGLDSRGWADMSLLAQVGFKYDGGFKLTPANESLDDLEDWHFGLFGGGSVPTGDENHRLADGSIDPGKSLGFGKPSFTLGVTASKQISRNLTLNLEASTLRFKENTYADGQRVRFGSENRVNAALAWRAYTNAEQKFRLDPVLELQYLQLGRDVEAGVGAQATGGKTLYAMPGVRAYWQNMSFALGVKKPVWTKLNESSEQQGSEGKEKYRLVFSASVMF